MKKHRDSVEYWKRVTLDSGGLGESHAAPQEQVLQFYLSTLEIHENEKVLDVGTGFGRLIPHLRWYTENVFGIDADPEMIDAAKESFPDLDGKLLLAYADKLPFEDNFFDTLVCWAVFDELPQAGSLKEFNRVLKPGGRLLITGKYYHYRKDDSEALAAEIGARRKKHSNNFTELTEAMLETFGFDELSASYFVKRGDFSGNDCVNDRPPRFYEYALLLEKKSDVKITDIENLPGIAREYSRTWLEHQLDADLSVKHAANQDASPILISGVYRSGTTFLTQVLGAHPDIFLTYDSVKYLRFALTPELYVKEPAGVLSAIEARLVKRWGMKFNAGEIAAMLKSPDIHANIYIKSLEYLRDAYKPGAKIVGEKIAVAWSQIPQFLDMFPQGKIIHIFRDPRDVVASYKAMTYEPGYAYLDAVFNFVHAIDSLQALREYYGVNQIYTLSLENLINNRVAELKKITDFLEVPYAEEMLDHSRFKSKDGGQWHHNSAFDMQDGSIDSTSERWREHLSTSEILFVEMIANRHMKNAGYELSGMNPTSADWEKIGEYLEDDFLSKRYRHWLNTGKGIEGYPSDPISKEIKLTESSGN